MNERKDDFLEPMDEQPSPKAHKQPQHHRRPRAMYFLLLVIFSAVFLLSGIYLAHYFVEQAQSASRYDGLNQIISSIQAAQPSEPPAPEKPTDTQAPSESMDATEPTEPVPPTMFPEYAAIYEMNNDLVGWLNIPSIDVKYPVLQTPDRPDYYLRRDFYGKYSTAGCLYVREACDVFAPSDNVVIYGHAMRSGDMFGRLSRYQDKSYWEENQYFTFDTLYEHHDYRIFAVFRTSGTWRVGYPYHLFNEAENEEDFNEFLANIKGAAFTMDKNKADGKNLFLGSVFYDTGITPQYGDKLLTLSTCEYSIRDPGTSKKNGRLVVVAVRVDCVCGE